MLGRDLQTLATAILLLSATVCKTQQTHFIPPAEQVVGGCNNLLPLSIGPHRRGLDRRARGPTCPSQRGQRVLKDAVCLFRLLLSFSVEEY